MCLAHVPTYLLQVAVQRHPLLSLAPLAFIDMASFGYRGDNGEFYFYIIVKFSACECLSAAVKSLLAQLALINLSSTNTALLGHVSSTEAHLQTGESQAKQ